MVHIYTLKQSIHTNKDDLKANLRESLHLGRGNQAPKNKACSFPQEPMSSAQSVAAKMAQWQSTCHASLTIELNPRTQVKLNTTGQSHNQERGDEKESRKAAG